MSPTFPLKVCVDNSITHSIPTPGALRSTSPSQTIPITVRLIPHFSISAFLWSERRFYDAAFDDQVLPQLGVGILFRSRPTVGRKCHDLAWTEDAGSVGEGIGGVGERTRNFDDHAVFEAEAGRHGGLLVSGLK